jgi:hypothetical protein
MSLLRALALFAFMITFATALHLTTHELLGLDSLNPMQTAQLMSGDWTAALPESIQGIAKKLLGK